MSWWPRNCPVCRQELPEKGNRRRYVPWLLGFRLVHADACAAAIDAQGVLELDRKPDVGVDVVTLVRFRRLAQLVVRQGERGDVTRQLFPDVTPLARRLAALDQEEVGRGPADRSRELLKLLVQRPEVSVRRRTVTAP